MEPRVMAKAQRLKVYVRFPCMLQLCCKDWKPGKGFLSIPCMCVPGNAIWESIEGIKVTLFWYSWGKAKYLRDEYFLCIIHVSTWFLFFMYFTTLSRTETNSLSLYYLHFTSNKQNIRQTNHTHFFSHWKLQQQISKERYLRRKQGR